jgi:hypothetical protein
MVRIKTIRTVAEDLLSEAIEVPGSEPLLISRNAASSAVSFPELL